MGKFIVPKADILVAVHNAICTIYRRRMQALRKAAERAARVSWFDRKGSPRERYVRAAHKLWHEPGVITEWRVWGGYALGVAQELRDACAVCQNDAVELSTEEAAFVKEWLKKS